MINVIKLVLVVGDLFRIPSWAYFFQIKEVWEEEEKEGIEEVSSGERGRGGGVKKEELVMVRRVVMEMESEEEEENKNE